MFKLCSQPRFWCRGRPNLGHLSSKESTPSFSCKQSFFYNIPLLDAPGCVIPFLALHLSGGLIGLPLLWQCSSSMTTQSPLIFVSPGSFSVSYSLSWASTTQGPPTRSRRALQGDDRRTTRVSFVLCTGRFVPCVNKDWVRWRLHLRIASSM